MQRRTVSLTVAVLAVLAAFVAISASETEANPPVYVTVSNMLDINSGAPLAGASILTRDNNSVTLNVSSANLDPGGVYTIWWIIFNDPSGCATTPCDFPDLGNAAAHPSVLWATGFIADATGTANFGARLERSNPPGQVLFGPGLANVTKAEVHIVVRTHGAPIPGMVDMQMSRFNGGCTADGAPPDMPGDACFDQQGSIHLPQ